MFSPHLRFPSIAFSRSCSHSKYRSPSFPYSEEPVLVSPFLSPCSTHWSLHCCIVFVHVCRSFLPTRGFPGGSAGKESSCNAGDLGSIPGLGRFLGEGNGYPLQCSGLENSMDCTVHAWGCKESDMTE